MSQNTQNTSKRRSAGTFDIRNIIALLLGIYGIVLVLCSFFLDPGVDPDTGGLKDSADNLWTGIGLVAVAAFFFIWAWLNPIVVQIPTEETEVK